MSSDPNRVTPIGLRISAIAASCPPSAFGTDLPLRLHHRGRSFQFPPPGYTAKWFAVAWFDRPDIWPPLYLSLRVAAIATFLALILGTLAAAALSRAKFFGRETISLLFILPIALPGIITGGSRCARRSSSWVSTSRSGPSSVATPTFCSGRLQQRYRPFPARLSGNLIDRPSISAPTASRLSVTDPAADRHGTSRRRACSRWRLLVRRGHRHDLHRRSAIHRSPSGCYRS